LVFLFSSLQTVYALFLLSLLSTHTQTNTLQNPYETA
jgi:hypothetical protein